MERGYFALWRKFQDHPFWQEKRVFSKAEAWIDILWEVQHTKTPIKVIVGMNILFCNYGESLKSIRTWAKRWGWGEAKTHRFLKLLKNLEQIDTVSETVTTRLTVLNYKQYDPRNIKNGTQAKRKRNASETQAKTDNNDKNDKHVNKKQQGIILPDWLPIDLWKDFKELRIKLKKPLTAKAEQLNINILEKLKKRGNDPKAVIEKTIERGWQGFFELPENKGENDGFQGNAGRASKETGSHREESDKYSGIGRTMLTE